jgi:hypothetical protein
MEAIADSFSGAGMERIRTGLKTGSWSLLYHPPKVHGVGLLATIIVRSNDGTGFAAGYDWWGTAKAGSWSTFSILVLPRLICSQGERAREDAGNAVRSVHMIGVGNGRGTCQSCKARTHQRKVFCFTPTIHVPLRTMQAKAKRATPRNKLPYSRSLLFRHSHGGSGCGSAHNPVPAAMSYGLSYERQVVAVG